MLHYIKATVVLCSNATVSDSTRQQPEWREDCLRCTLLVKSLAPTTFGRGLKSVATNQKTTFIKHQLNKNFQDESFKVTLTLKQHHPKMSPFLDTTIVAHNFAFH